MSIPTVETDQLGGCDMTPFARYFFFFFCIGLLLYKKFRLFLIIIIEFSNIYDLIKMLYIKSARFNYLLILFTLSKANSWKCLNNFFSLLVYYYFIYVNMFSLRLLKLFFLFLAHHSDTQEICLFICWIIFILCILIIIICMNNVCMFFFFNN